MTAKGPARTRMNPAFIRAVLEEAERTSGYAAAKKHGVSHRAVYKWVERREASGGVWPTDSDIEAWQIDNARNWELRRRKAATAQTYRKRRYLLRGAHMHIDATGTTRRLQALHALGWTSPQIAARLGVSPARVNHLVCGTWVKVHRDTAAAVAALYDEWCMTRPEDPAVLPPRHVRVHERQRRQSARRGFAGPLAWDNIDDPAEKPQGIRRRRSEPAGAVDVMKIERRLSGDRSVRLLPGETAEAVRLGQARGMNVADLERLGIRPDRYPTKDAS